MSDRERKERVGPSPAEVQAGERQLVEQQRVLEYDTKEFTVELLVQKFGAGGDDDDIYIPSYQRYFSWETTRQSRFIESVLMGLPIPFLFFGDNKSDGRLEVVDGSQRLHTCRAFLAGELELAGCERLTLLDGFRFGDLTSTQQRRLKNRTIRAVVLSPKATEDDRRDLFDRINTGSLIAMPAEVRRGKIPGPVTDLIDQLARDALFLKLCPMSAASVKLRTHEELVTRFFAFGERFDNDLPGYKDRIRDYLDDWLKSANRQAQSRQGSTKTLQATFGRVMKFVAKHFPNGFAKTSRSNFTPSVRFDAIAVGVQMALRARPKLVPTTPPVRWLESEEFFTLTTSNAANVRSKVVARIEYVRDQLLGG